MTSPGARREPDATPTVARADRWRLRTRVLSLPRCPLVMGILNVTPDSFSDGGKFADIRAAIDHGQRLIDEGAALVDVGGESTRPGSSPVSRDEELRRVLPVVEALAVAGGVPISIDTTKAAVARAAIAAGAEIINDVSGLEADPAMVPLAAETGAAVCAMHMRGTPRTMQSLAAYEDVVAEVGQYLASRRDALLAAGVARERICLDPGIGFAKTNAQSLELLRRIRSLHALGCPVLVGHSRKGFLAKVLGDEQADRTAATIGVSLALAAQGVQIVRVHDVRAVREALLLFEASGGCPAWQ